MLYHNGARIELQLREKLEQRAASDLPLFSVDYDIHFRILRTASPGSASSHSARIAATP
jgi:hypothetical protein